MPDDEKPIAYDAYQKLAQAYANKLDTKPHNAYYERPAMLGLLPKVAGMKVLDAGCGPGAYAEELANRGADVLAFDASDKMLDQAEQRLEGAARLMQVDMSKPLTMFDDEAFDLVNAPLCMDYIEDWYNLCQEFYRVLKPGGWFLFSCGHPQFDAQYFDTQNYFSVERVTATWRGFGIEVEMPGHRRSLQEMLMPGIAAGFTLDKVLEPLPTDDFRRTDLLRYKQLMHRPCFLCLRWRKPVS